MRSVRWVRSVRCVRSRGELARLPPQPVRRQAGLEQPDGVSLKRSLKQSERSAPRAPDREIASPLPPARPPKGVTKARPPPARASADRTHGGMEAFCVSLRGRPTSTVGCASPPAAGRPRARHRRSRRHVARTATSTAPGWVLIRQNRKVARLHASSGLSTRWFSVHLGHEQSAGAVQMDPDRRQLHACQGRNLLSGHLLQLEQDQDAAVFLR